ncbi:MAG TPA: FAD/NAD(P)-binding protein [Sphingomicrobium sp.]|nr:FAD/NAD(P)-binding protein [Sphingomicrobium sp.]
MKSDRRLPVAIIGGGFSGTILAAQLARRGIDCALVDGSGRLGKGVAYSTTEPAHLLNVRAEGMSAWAGDPGHFAQHFEEQGGDRRGFAQRRLFARYLAGIFEEAVASRHLEPIQRSAVSAQRRDGAWHVELDDGSAIEAQSVALAIGNQEPGSLPALAGAGDRYIANPWGSDAWSAVQDLAGSGGAALLVGTGLTMVDLVLSLDAAGHQGEIVAVSRRGLAPRGHADFEPAPVELKDVPHGNVGGLLRWLRERGAQVGWRAAIDSLRPHSQTLWQSLGTEQQKRFLRHARPWWDVHRHRIAPEVAATVARLIAEGRLQVMAGRIVSASPREDGLDVEVLRRGAAGPRRRSFAYAFNCTGPLHSIERTRDRLLRSLLDRGEVGPDALGIGLNVDENSRAGERLWALGPLTKGNYWEIIAVPDIREQAALVAEDISREVDK